MKLCFERAATWNVALWCLLLASPLSVHAQVGNTPLLALETDDWAPWVDSKTADGGPFTRLVAMVCEGAGTVPVVGYVPWKRAEADLLAGTVFGAFPYRETPDRLKQYWFSDVVVITRGMVFARKQGLVPQLSELASLDTLRPYHFAAVLGSWYQPTFESTGLNVVWVADLKLAMRMLQEGRVDLVAAEEKAGWNAVDLIGEPRANIVALARPNSTSELRIMVSRTWSHAESVLGQLNRSLAKVRTTEKWKLILSGLGLD